MGNLLVTCIPYVSEQKEKKLEIKNNAERDKIDNTINMLKQMLDISDDSIDHLEKEMRRLALQIKAMSDSKIKNKFELKNRMRKFKQTKDRLFIIDKQRTQVDELVHNITLNLQRKDYANNINNAVKNLSSISNESTLDVVNDTIDNMEDVKEMLKKASGLMEKMEEPALTEQTEEELLEEIMNLEFEEITQIAETDDQVVVNGKSEVEGERDELLSQRDKIKSPQLDADEAKKRQKPKKHSRPSHSSKTNEEQSRTTTVRNSPKTLVLT